MIWCHQVSSFMSTLSPSPGWQANTEREKVPFLVTDLGSFTFTVCSFVSSATTSSLERNLRSDPACGLVFTVVNTNSDTVESGLTRLVMQVFSPVGQFGGMYS